MTPQRRKLLILGSTGSIGTQALEVVEALHEETAGAPDLDADALAPYLALNDALRAARA